MIHSLDSYFSANVTLEINLSRGIVRITKPIFQSAVDSTREVTARLSPDCWKRETFPFKTLFVSSRYDFPFLRYHRLKWSLIFGGLLTLSLARDRASRSHTPSLTCLARRPRALVSARHRLGFFFCRAYSLPGKETRSRGLQGLQLPFIK